MKKVFYELNEEKLWFENSSTRRLTITISLIKIIAYYNFKTIKAK